VKYFVKALIVPVICCMIIGLILPVASAAAGSAIYIENGQQVEQPSEKPLKDLKMLAPGQDGCQRLSDYALGYRLDIPEGMQLDLSLSALRTVAYNNDTRIEIYHDNFNSSTSCTSAAAFINYNNRFLNNARDHHLLERSYIQNDDLSYYLLRWTRDKLAHVDNDHNYYARAYYVISPQEVYTVWIKSAQPIENYERIFGSFARVDKRGAPGYFARYSPVEREWNESTRAFYEKYFNKEAALTWGIFEPTAPDSFNYLSQLEKRFDYSFPVILVYKSMDSTMPLADLQRAYEQGKAVELTLQTSSFELSDADNQRVTYDILQGVYDEFFHQYARQIKEFGEPVLFRLDNEMNGDWCTYSSYYTGGDTELFKALWRYVYEVFASEQVDNVIWVWNPHDLSFPDFKWNHAYMYYPGDQYVDVVGLTGYNTGNYYPGETWREFPVIYDLLVRSYASVFSYPFMITEFGSNSVGGDKKAWIDNMFANIDRYPQIKMAVWWNGIDWDSQMQPARIYRIDENPAVINAFKTGLADKQ